MDVFLATFYTWACLILSKIKINSWNASSAFITLYNNLKINHYIVHFSEQQSSQRSDYTVFEIVEWKMARLKSE